MSDLNTQFEEAAANAQNLKKKPDNDTLLKLYSLYKQGSKGDVAGSRPGFTNPIGRAKFDAWAKLKGTSKNEAMQSYIDLIGSLQ